MRIDRCIRLAALVCMLSATAARAQAPTPTAFPVGQFKTPGGVEECLGTVVSCTQVLTAAHCIPNSATFEIGGQSFDLSAGSVSVDPTADVAVVALAPPAGSCLSDNETPISCLPPQDPGGTDDDFVQTTLDDNGNPVDNDRSDLNNIDGRNMIFQGNLTRGGDSGGPVTDGAGGGINGVASFVGTLDLDGDGEPDTSLDVAVTPDPGHMRENGLLCEFPPVLPNSCMTNLTQCHACCLQAQTSCRAQIAGSNDWRIALSCNRSYKACGDGCVAAFGG